MCPHHTLGLGKSHPSMSKRNFSLVKRRTHCYYFLNFLTRLFVYFFSQDVALETLWEDRTCMITFFRRFG